MHPGAKAIDGRVGKYVAGLVREAGPHFGLLYGRPPKLSDPARVDGRDKRWFRKMALKTMGFPEKMGYCARIELEAVPKWYRKSVHGFVSLMEPAASDPLAYIPPEAVASADALLGNFSVPLRKRWKLPRPALDAVQRVVDDLFDGFLSAPDRRKAGLELEGTPATPLAYFAEGALPFVQKNYRFKFTFDICLVGYPRWLSKGGIAFWVALAHETCGHAFLNAYPSLSIGLRERLKTQLRQKLGSRKGAVRYSPRDIEQITLYWMYRFEEALSDCLGILAIGPVLAFALLAKTEIEGWGDPKRDALDPHPSNPMRCYLAACVVGELAFSGAKELKHSLLSFLESRRQSLPPSEREYWSPDMWLVDLETRTAAAEESASILAQCLVKTPLSRRGGKTIGDLQNWADGDENAARRVARCLGGPARSFPETWRRFRRKHASVYPLHIVAGASMALADREAGGHRRIFGNMLHAINAYPCRNDYREEYDSGMYEAADGLGRG